MKGYELYGMFVRSLGLWLIVQGVIAIPTALAVGLALVSQVVSIVVGGVLYFGADGFVRTTYHRVALDELEPPISH